MPKKANDLTGLKFGNLTVVRRGNGRKYSGANYKQPSIDRIDNSKGYIKCNIQFTCAIVNYARNTFSIEEMKDFCRAVASVGATECIEPKGV